MGNCGPQDDHWLLASKVNHSEALISGGLGCIKEHHGFRMGRNVGRQVEHVKPPAGLACLASEPGLGLLLAALVLGQGY